MPSCIEIQNTEDLRIEDSIILVVLEFVQNKYFKYTYKLRLYQKCILLSQPFYANATSEPLVKILIVICANNVIFFCAYSYFFMKQCFSLKQICVNSMYYELYNL